MNIFTKGRFIKKGGKNTCKSPIIYMKLVHIWPSILDQVSVVNVNVMPFGGINNSEIVICHPNKCTHLKILRCILLHIFNLFLVFYM